MADALPTPKWVFAPTSNVKKAALRATWFAIPDEYKEGIEIYPQLVRELVVDINKAKRKYWDKHYAHGAATNRAAACGSNPRTITAAECAITAAECNAWLATLPAPEFN